MTISQNSQSESTLTDRYQTTIPAATRKYLGLAKGDRISYKIQSDGQVTISRADKSEEDPVLGKFLDFLAQDISKNPQKIKTIPADLVSHVQALVSGVELDLDAPLTDEDE